MEAALHDDITALHDEASSITSRFHGLRHQDLLQAPLEPTPVVLKSFKNLTISNIRTSEVAGKILEPEIGFKRTQWFE